MKKEVDDSWRPMLEEEFQQPYFRELESFVDEARKQGPVFPAEAEVFQAFHLTPFENVKVVILGQDPYHGPGQAHGLSFSVREQVKIPPSLRNIFRELESDLQLKVPDGGDLTPWAKQGVLLLNTVLTVDAHQANSHQKKGWEKFTDRVIQKIGSRDQHTVFLLWGKPAQAKQSGIDPTNHTLLVSTHPSPLSAHRGFFGSRPFSKTNQALLRNGQTEIDWQL